MTKNIQKIYRKWGPGERKKQSWRWWIELCSFYALTESARQPLTGAILFNLAGPEIKKRKLSARGEERQSEARRRRKRKYVRRLHNNTGGGPAKMARSWRLKMANGGQRMENEEWSMEPGQELLASLLLHSATCDNNKSFYCRRTQMRQRGFGFGLALAGSGLGRAQEEKLKRQREISPRFGCRIMHRKIPHALGSYLS